MAANYKANPFTLTYDGAIRENVKGQVNLHTVHYPANGIEAAANVYTPANFDPAKSYPAIVVAHPNGGVKEQVAGLYAQKLAEAGYVTIAFDAAYQGASGGKPRYIDKPQFRIEDIRAAADYISQYQGVDAKRQALQGGGDRVDVQQRRCTAQRLHALTNRHHSGALGTGRCRPRSGSGGRRSAVFPCLCGRHEQGKSRRTAL